MLMNIDRRKFLKAALALPAAGLVSGCASSSSPASSIERLGASTACIAGGSLDDAIDQMQQLGFGTLEMISYTGASHSMGKIPGFDYYKATEKQRQQVYKATRVFQHISAHMPFIDIDLLSSDKKVRQENIKQIKQAIDGLAFLEGSLAVVHPGWPEKGKSFRDIWPQMLGTFRLLGDYAEERGIKIGLETMQPNSVKDYTELIFDIDHPAVGATIDTGHIRGATDIGLPDNQRDSREGKTRFNEVLNRIVDILGEKVLHVHLTDVRSSDWDDHHTVGSGIIDFPRFFKSLHRVGYSGLFVFELEEPQQIKALKKSKAHVEDLIVG